MGIKRGKDLQVDCLINKNGKIKLIEIKDGDVFDTKKVAGELESLQLAKEHLARKGAKENISVHYIQARIPLSLDIGGIAFAFLVILAPSNFLFNIFYF
jgi:hypothetical protein